MTITVTEYNTVVRGLQMQGELQHRSAASWREKAEALEASLKHADDRAAAVAAQLIAEQRALKCQAALRQPQRKARK